MDDKSLENIHASSDNLYVDVRLIVETAQRQAYTAVNVALVQRNWLIGKRIAEEELKGESRAEYGAEIIKQLSNSLTTDYGKGFDFSTLYKFVNFYKCFPNILDSASPKSVLLTWTHYGTLLREENADARFWYEKEAATQQWEFNGRWKTG